MDRGLPSERSASRELLTAAVSARGNETMVRALNVVEEILDESGEAGLRLGEVSRRSGVSIGSIYHHFGSREGLIRAARERQFMQSLVDDGTAIASVLAAAGSASELLVNIESVVQTVQSTSRIRNRMRRVELIGSAASRPDLLHSISAVQTVVMDAAEDLAISCRDRGWLRKGVEPRALALYVQATTLGRVLGDLDQRGTDDAAWVDILMLALRGMFVLDDEESQSTPPAAQAEG
jgi:AcrR family transcriptional regulator